MPEFASPPVLLIVFAVIGYLLGSIPSGVVIAKAMGLGNLRDIGSGNIGATNVLRTGNKKAAAFTLLFDALKGAVAVLAGRFLVGEDAAQIAGLGALIGHCFPVWLGFKGGKGVATWFGVMLALVPLAGLIACAIWLVVAAVSRYSSLAALLAVFWMPIVVNFTDNRAATLLAMAMLVIIYIRHRENLKRLKAGTEAKIGAKTKSDGA